MSVAMPEEEIALGHTSLLVESGIQALYENS
jgi:hypothetical protein